MPTEIPWCDETLNVVTGCSHAGSPACDNCYAKPMARRLKAMGMKAYKREFKPTPHPELLRKPDRWRKPRRVFICSMGDLFHERIPFEFIASVFVMMINNPKHIFQVLTKRPERMKEFFEWLFEDWHRLMDASLLKIPKVAEFGLGVCEELRKTGIHLEMKQWYPRNIWGGITAENQEQLEKRVVDLQLCPFNVRFLSLEPLLGPIKFSVPEIGEVPKWPPIHHLPNSSEWDEWKFWQHRGNGVHWVIVGGESGPRARPMHPQWVRDIRDQCEEAKIPIFFKQWGEWGEVDYCTEATHTVRETDGHIHKLDHAPSSMSRTIAVPNGWCGIKKMGKKVTGDLLDGVEHKEFPTGSERP